MEHSHTWDVLVIGGGAAGLSAALTLGRARRRVLVVDAGEPRNRYAAHMHGVLGHEGLDPAELLRRGRAEIAEYGVEVVTGTVDRLEDHPDGAGLIATLADGSRHAARSTLVATGLTDELPAVPGLAERWGTGVVHCPYCHGWEVRDQRLGVLATGPFSVHLTELIRQWSDDVVLFSDALGDLPVETVRRLESRGVRIVTSPVIEVLGPDGTVTGVRTEEGVVEVGALFVGATPRPHEGFLGGLDLAHEEGPLGPVLAVDPMTGRTSHPWVWAAGNVVNPGLNVPMSISAGVSAAAMLNMALISSEFDAAEAEVPAVHWEARYNDTGDQAQIWSGRVNATTAAVAATLTPGRALDLGCGEGGDVIWLAEQGWQVTGVDISPTAVARGAEAAAARGLEERATWIAHDLETWEPQASYDLVTASFFHSMVDLDRTEILRRAAASIAPGGHLLIVSHAAFPPWSKAAQEHQHEDHSHEDHTHGGGHHHHDFLSPDQEIAELDLPDGQWETVLAETRSRDAVGPDGTEATLEDGVVLLRRL